jgi:hypothetical protein
VSCPSGKCWAGERTQNYAQCGRGELISPKVNLSACAAKEVSLVFTHAYDFWTGDYNGQTWYDGATIEVSGTDGSSWQIPASSSYSGTVKINPSRSGGYDCVRPNSFHVNNKTGYIKQQLTPTTVEIPLPAGVLTNAFRVRFSMAAGVSWPTSSSSDRSHTRPGWRIDDVHFVLR